MLDKRVCSICAWRENCQKRFMVSVDAHFNVHCPDYTQDVRIKDSEIDAKIVEYQIERWRRSGKSNQDVVVTISRQAGAGGSEIARRLAEEFKMDLIGRQIIQYVAKSAGMTTQVVEFLDEKAVSRIDSMINSMFVNRHLSTDVYFRHLTRAIATIGEHGNAIIVGRGAHLLLPKEKTLRFRFIAPQECRIRHFMKSRDMTKAEAEKYVEKRDADRTGFIQKYFKADADDPGHFDLVVNTEMLGIEGAFRIVSAAIRQRIKTGPEPATLTTERRRTRRPDVKK
jgi:cytidylate kinase